MSDVKKVNDLEFGSTWPDRNAGFSFKDTIKSFKDDLPKTRWICLCDEKVANMGHLEVWA